MSDHRSDHINTITALTPLTPTLSWLAVQHWHFTFTTHTCSVYTCIHVYTYIYMYGVCTLYHNNMCTYELLQYTHTYSCILCMWLYTMYVAVYYVCGCILCMCIYLLQHLHIQLHIVYSNMYVYRTLYTYTAV